MKEARPAVFLPDTLFHGRYRVARCLKLGGMGAVYEVRDGKTDARRALKVMLPDIVEDAELRGRFALEMRITSEIESDHIIRILDAGVDEATGIPFLVMDLLRGEDLGSMLERRGALSRTEVALYLSQVSLALDKTHGSGIVHRDLKPENLFLTLRDDGSPCIKILDFGIAKVLGSSARTHGTKSIGTPLYMAPEQVRGDLMAIGPQTDIYSIGHIAYSLLVGEPYWTEELKAAGALLPFFTKVVGGAREPAIQRAARRGVELSDAFDAWFKKATSIEPDDRFRDASAAAAALADALSVTIPKFSLVDLEPPRVAPKEEAPITVKGAGSGGDDTEEIVSGEATTMPANGEGARPESRPPELRSKTQSHTVDATTVDHARRASSRSGPAFLLGLLALAIVAGAMSFVLRRAPLVSASAALPEAVGQVVGAARESAASQASVPSSASAAPAMSALQAPSLSSNHSPAPTPSVISRGAGPSLPRSTPSKASASTTPQAPPPAAITPPAEGPRREGFY